MPTPQERVIRLKPGDTEPLEAVVSATGLSNLDQVASGGVAWYAWLRGNATNHVDGAQGSVSDSANRKVQLDPDGAKSGGGTAFDAEGIYEAYVKLTFADGDEIRFPGDDDENLRIEVGEDRES